VKFLIILFFCLSLKAEYNFSGNVDTYLAWAEMGEENDYITMTTTQINNDYAYNNFIFQSTLNAYKYKRNDGTKISSNSIDEYFPEEKISFRSLYIGYSDNTKTFGVGIIPLSQTNYSTTSSDLVEKGNGMMIINEIDLFGVFYKIKNNNNNSLFIIAKDNEKLPVDTFNNSHRRDNEYLFYMFDYALDNSKYSFEYSYSKHYEQGIYTGNLNIVGLEYLYKNDKTGVLFKSEVGYSIYNNNSYNIKDICYTDTPETSYDKNKNYYGQSLLLGFRKDFNIFLKDAFVYVEYFKPFNNWFSLNNGSLQENSYNAVFNVGEYSSIISFGYNINKNLLVLVDASKTKTLKYEIAGAEFKRTDENSNGSDLDMIKLKLRYKF
jgi:hypothetical protein